MEILTSFGLLFFFSFFYWLAREHEDFFLEWLGCFGIFFIGMLMFTTGVQAYSFNAEALVIAEIPGVAPIGLFILFIGLMLLLWSYRSYAKMKKEG